MSDLLLAIPAYNEGERLPRFLPSLERELSKSNFQIRVRIVDDGSDQEHVDAIQSCIREIDSPLIAPTLQHERNRGKGAAIQTAWNAAGDCKMLGFIDADGSIGAHDALRLCEAALAEREKLWIASRGFPKRSRVKRTLFRKFASSVFHTIVHTRYGIRFKDTQCGMKVIPTAFYRERSTTFEQQGFAFDLELLIKAAEAGLEIVEFPVNWSEMAGGHLSQRAGLALIRDVLLRRI